MTVLIQTQSEACIKFSWLEHLWMNFVFDCIKKMHFVQIHSFIKKMINFLYRIGFWNRGEKATITELGIKFAYCIYHSIFVVSLMLGAINSDDRDYSIFLAEIAIIGAVLSVKLWVLIWNQTTILELLNRICIFSIRRDDDCNLVTDKLSKFFKFVIALLTYLMVADLCVMGVAPFIGNRRTLYFKVAFPLDWRKDDFSFWAANLFVFTGLMLSMAAFALSITLWYLLLVSSIRYRELGNELRDLDLVRAEENSSNNLEKVEGNTFLHNLRTSIDVHLDLWQSINELESFGSNLFFIRIATSGICTCASVYCLAFDVSDNLVERIIHIFTLIYNISEIFMITYLGNEVKVSSDHLSYSLFQSNWTVQPQTVKKYVIIFGERLKRPQELVVRNLYPLTLNTFTRILNSVYSMFNILKNTKQ